MHLRHFSGLIREGRPKQILRGKLKKEREAQGTLHENKCNGISQVLFLLNLCLKCVIFM